jgi:hypothetical protein
MVLQKVELADIVTGDGYYDTSANTDYHLQVDVTEQTGEPLAIVGVEDEMLYFNRDIPLRAQVVGGSGNVTVVVDGMPTDEREFVFVAEGGHSIEAFDDLNPEGISKSFAIKLDIIINDPNPINMDNDTYGLGYIRVQGNNALSTSQATFNINHTFVHGRGELVIGHDTQMSIASGAPMNLLQFLTRDITDEVRVEGQNTRAALRIGMIDNSVRFSHPVTINLTVGSQYENKRAQVISRPSGGTEWENETICDIDAQGVCSFFTDHATDYAALEPQTISNGDDGNLEIDIQDTAVLACTDGIDFNILIPGTPQARSSSCSVTTNAELGYDLQVKKDDTDATMDHERESGAAIADLAAWDGNAGSTVDWSSSVKGLGFTIISAPTKDTSAWGTGITEDDEDNKYAGFPAIFTNIVDHDLYSAEPTMTMIGYKLDVPATQRSGAYAGGVTYQFVTKP